MSVNVFEIWPPAACLSTQMYFSELRESQGILSIFLKFSDKPDSTLKIDFKGFLGYKVFQEGSRLKFLGEHQFFGLINVSVSSIFLEWFLQESEGLFYDWNLKHFMVCNADSIIDVITVEPPDISWV
ncbi:hypothetical protein [Sphingobacterium endophyticum]|uniref:hypothetical protein n=1 Tax=Sphingobacterium endophyticum TaxID=2546448 RepID=UPI0012E22FBE|nr:hypothetical protein [Sphingobacterium endophyticum]